MAKNRADKNFVPDWVHEAPNPGSYRSIFKWGAPEAFKHPNRRLYKLIKETLGLTDGDFRTRLSPRDEAVRCDRKTGPTKNHIAALRRITGNENVQTDDYSRVSHAFGKTVEEAEKLRHGIVDRAAEGPPHH